MVKNIKGGCKGKNIARKNIAQVNNSPARLPSDPDEMIAVVIKLNGGGRIKVATCDGHEYTCIIRRKFSGRRKRSSLITLGGLIMVGKRSYESTDKTVDLLEVYDASEHQELRANPMYKIASFDRVINALSTGKSCKSEGDDILFTSECDHLKYDDDDDVCMSSSSVVKSASSDETSAVIPAGETKKIDIHTWLEDNFDDI